MNANNSEVARLLRLIQAEYEASSNALTGLSVSSRHDFINARMNNVGGLQAQLQQHVGNEEAWKLIVKKLNG